MRLAILMPSYNEGERLNATLQRLAAFALDHDLQLALFIVDDGGSHAVCATRLPDDADHFWITLLRHPLNLGQGAALETARRIALSRGPFDAYVTMDSDGQHAPEDLPQFCDAIAAGADVVFGNRFGGDSNVPGMRRLVLLCARMFERVLTGLSLADAHNGYRAFSQKGIMNISIAQSRMAHATEIKQHVARACNTLKSAEVPVSISYSSDTLQKGQSSLGGLQILWDLFYGYVFGSNRR